MLNSRYSNIRVVVAVCVALTLTCCISAGTALADKAVMKAAKPKLDWQPCSNPAFNRWKKIDSAALDGFDCAVFTRPLARNNPSGSQVKLAVVRRKATGTPQQYKGTLFLNPGGPGQSGVGLSVLDLLLPAQMHESFDFISWDPRGIGASTPAITGPGCNIAEPTRPVTGTVDWEEVLDRRIAQVNRDNARCYAGNKAIIDHGGTIDNVYDLDALRSAVGDSKLTYWGISYGTLLGSTYAQIFPKKVRAVVFDGNIDPQTTLHEIAGAGSDAPDHSIGFYLQANPQQASQYRAVMKALNKRVLKLPNGTSYTRWDVLDQLNASTPFLINPGQDWANATTVIQTTYAALFGAGAERDTASKALTNTALQSPSTGTVGGLWSAVVCQDFTDRITHKQQHQILDRVVNEGTIYGGSLGVDYLTTCNGYDNAKPHPVPRPKQYGPDIPGVISNATRDGETPYQWAVNMGRTYPQMRTITIVGGIHGTFGLSGSDCVDSAITNFLISPVEPTVDLACPFAPPASTSG